MVESMIIDVTRLVARQLDDIIPSGVDQVSLEYVAYFKKTAYALVRLKFIWIFLNKKDSELLFTFLLTKKKQKKYIKFLIIKNLLLNSLGFGRKEKCWLLNTGHSGLHLKSYGKNIEKFSLKPIFFIHDLIPITHPEYCRKGESEKHIIRVITALHYHKLIIVNSLDTQNKLQFFSINHGFFESNILINFLGTKEFKNNKVFAKKNNSKKKYFVILGTVEARKNHNLLLYIWKSLIEKKHENIPQLIIIGRRGWECENTIALLERCEILKPFIKELNNCSDSELLTWLSGAQALLFPSFVEGFGMPLAEAYAVGVPVIASDLAVYREFAGDTPDYLDPLDAIKWREYILDYSQEVSILRQKQLERMQNFSCPTWEKHFAVLQCYLSKLYGN